MKINNQDIKIMLAKQLGEKIGIKKKELDTQISVLQGIVHSELPCYRKWEISQGWPSKQVIKYLFCIRLKQGRIEVDRIKFDNHRVEYDTNNHSIVVDSSFETATKEEWDDGIFKLMDYING
jgi:hypothetical protein